MKHILSSILVSCMIFTTFAQIPNPGFESWTSTGFPAYQNPNSWGNLNGATAITGTLTCERGSGADAHSGSYAIKLTAKSVFGQSAPGIAVTGTINTGTQELEGGFAYTQRPTHLKGWYKCSPVSGDNCEVRVTLWKRNAGVLEDVGEGVILPNTVIPNYTMFLIPITYTSANAPDSGRILLVSTNTNNIQVGSQLFVDDLEFVDCGSLSVSLSTTPVSTVGGADGSATASPSGGTAPYNYYWSPSAQATQTIINLGAGSYCVTVGDANGCTSTTACQDVAGPDCSTLAASVTTHDATTTGGNDGSAAATATGGNPPYTYAWVTGETTDSISSLTKAVYCVTVTDASGCTVSNCGTVSDPGCTTLTLLVISTDATTLSGSDGSATAVVTGGTPGYAFLWNTTPPETSSTIINLSAGNYCVTVTDANNCNATDCVTVSEPGCSGFSVVATGTDVTTVGGSDGTASAAPLGGVAPYSYDWSTSDTAQNLSSLPQGVYCVTATDAVGCANDTCVTIIGPDCSGFSVSVTTTPSFDYPAGTASANTTGGTTPIAYSWNTSDTSQNLTDLVAGTYCVTATDVSGCTVTDCDTVETSINVNSPLVAGIKLFPNPAGNVVTIELENAAAYRFRLFDAVGKTVADRILNTKSSVIPLNGILPGHYLYELKNIGDGNMLTGKLVVE